ncbi:spinocerebellar ataxia type 10 protein domain-containing protein [Cladochytrium replicatum]|nr:spinocerebellar ataxia type 10 protein domain-containing protein [Cladochytrium replicatum]
MDPSKDGSECRGSLAQCSRAVMTALCPSNHSDLVQKLSSSWKPILAKAAPNRPNDPATSPSALSASVLKTTLFNVYSSPEKGAEDSPPEYTPSPTSLTIEPEEMALIAKSVEEVAKLMVKDEKARQNVGRQLSWIDTSCVLMHLRNSIFVIFGSGKNGVACSSRARELTVLTSAHFLLIRNLCANVPANQIRSCDAQVYESAEEIIQYLVSWIITTRKNPCVQVQDQALACVNLGVQMIANMMTGNQDVMNCLWPRFVGESDMLKQLLEMNEPTTTHYVFMIIYNNVHKDLSRSLALVRGRYGCHLVKGLLRGAKECCHDEGTTFDIIYLIFVNLIELHLTPAVMEVMYKYGSRPDRTSLLTIEHITFLKLLDGLIDVRQREDGVFINLGTDTLRYMVKPLKRLVLHIIESLQHHEQIRRRIAANNSASSFGSPSGSPVLPHPEGQLPYVQVAPPTTPPPHSPASPPTMNGSRSHSNSSTGRASAEAGEAAAAAAILRNPIMISEIDTEGLSLLLQIFGRMSSDPKWSAPLRVALSSDGLIESVILLVKVVPRVRRPTQLSPTSPNNASADPSASACSLSLVPPMKTEAVRVIGNVSYGCQCVQDEVRRLGGLILVLELCNYDESNPYIREHAIFAIRNLCEANTENQNVIAQLEARKATLDVERSSGDVEAVLDESGRVRLQHRAGQQQQQQQQEQQQGGGWNALSDALRDVDMSGP